MKTPTKTVSILTARKITSTADKLPVVGAYIVVDCGLADDNSVQVPIEDGTLEHVCETEDDADWAADEIDAMSGNAVVALVV